METNLDQWNKIAELINKEKKRALDDFHLIDLVPGDLPAHGAVPLSSRRLVMGPAIMAVAASLLLAIAVTFFMLLQNSGQKTTQKTPLAMLLADSILYRQRQPEVATLRSNAISRFAPLLTAWAEAARLSTAAVPAAEPIDPSASVERGDPEAVRQKIEKVIRENTLERLLTRMRYIYKEV